MKRFIKLFSWHPCFLQGLEEKINQYSEENGCTIISVTPIGEAAIAVVFEGGEQR